MKDEMLTNKLNFHDGNDGERFYVGRQGMHCGAPLDVLRDGVWLKGRFEMTAADAGAEWTGSRIPLLFLSDDRVVTIQPDDEVRIPEDA